MTTAWCSPSPRHATHSKQQQGQEEEEEEEDDENVQQLEDCARLYKCLEDCLVKTDRNWRACQTEVKALKDCHEAKARTQSPSTSTGKK